MTSRSPQGESQRQKREPLEGNTRFQKIQVRRAHLLHQVLHPCMETTGRHAGTLLDSDLHAATVQALNSGSYGFVYLCKDLRTGELVAIKFIERGEKVTKASWTPCCLGATCNGSATL